MSNRLTITVEPGGELRCTGEIDQTTTGLLRHALARATGGDPLVVDLTRVDYLSSAGIAVLFEHADTNPITVRVRAGSAVDKVVRLCGLGIVAKIEEIPPNQDRAAPANHTSLTAAGNLRVDQAQPEGGRSAGVDVSAKSDGHPDTSHDQSRAITLIRPPPPTDPTRTHGR